MFSSAAVTKLKAVAAFRRASRRASSAHLVGSARIAQLKSQNFGLPRIGSDLHRIGLRCQTAIRMMEDKQRSAVAATRLGALIYDIMKSNELYRASDHETTLTLAGCRQLCRQATVRRYGVGQTIFKRGDRGTGMYLVLEGEATVLVGGHVKAVLSPGTSFGELSLILDQPRSATIVSKNQCSLMFIPKASYVSVMQGQQDARFTARAKFLSKLTIFKAYPMAWLKPMSILFKDAMFPGGHTVWRGDTDDLTDAIYFIRSGQCELRWYEQSLSEGGTLNGRFFRVCQLGPCQCFGDIAFAAGRDPHIAVVTKTRVELWSLPFARVEQLGAAKDVLMTNALLKVKWQQERIATLKTKEIVDMQSPKHAEQKKPSLSSERLEHARREVDQRKSGPNWSPIRTSPSDLQDSQALLRQQNYRFAKRDAGMTSLPNVYVASLVDDFNSGNPKLDPTTKRLATLLNDHVESGRNPLARLGSPFGRLPVIRTTPHKNLPTLPMSISPMRGSFVTCGFKHS